MKFQGGSLEQKMIDICILSWNNIYSLGYCLESIKRYTKSEHRLFVIDNNSDEQVKEWLKLQKGIEVIWNTENKMFTNAYADFLNRQDISPYVVIINNDCMVEPNWLEPLFDFMEKNKKVGIAGPQLLDITGQRIINAGGLVDFYGHKNGIRDLHYLNPSKELWMTFACVMIRTSIYKQIGGLDRNLIHYCQDSDLCIRMNILDYETWYIPESKIRHEHMISTKEAFKRNGKGMQEIINKDQQYFQQKWGREGLRNGNNWFGLQEAILN